MTAGPLKNSIPVTGRELLEEVHVIAIPPFSGDRQNWKEASYEVVFSSKRISVLPPDRLDASLKGAVPDFESLEPADRAGALGRLGKRLQADAVLNGMILPKDDQSELVLQLISLPDGRLLFWQSVDLSPKDGQIEPSVRKAVLAEMLAPVLEQAGRRKKPAPVPAAVRPHKEPAPPALEPEPDLPPSVDQTPKPDKKPRRLKPSRPSETISPM